jgi:hypothetical protein
MGRLKEWRSGGDVKTLRKVRVIASLVKVSLTYANFGEAAV